MSRNVMADPSNQSTDKDAISCKKPVVFKCQNHLIQLTMEDLAKIPFLHRLYTNANFFKEKPDKDNVIVLRDDVCDAGLLRAVVKYIQSGNLRCLFSEIPSSCDSAWKIFEFIDFLLVEKIPSDDLDVDHLHFAIQASPLDCRYMTNKSLARDLCVKICWKWMDVDDDAVDYKERKKLYKMVLFVVSHPGLFNARLRQVTLDWYLHHIEPTVKQRRRLERWSKKFENERKGSADDDKSNVGSESSVEIKVTNDRLDITS